MMVEVDNVVELAKLAIDILPATSIPMAGMLLVLLSLYVTDAVAVVKLFLVKLLEGSRLTQLVIAAPSLI